jgi:hypothetical protein
MIETRVINAVCLRVEHPESSYGTFCYNEIGDLFLQSDWGFYGYSWRAFGDSFSEFLMDIDADYVVQKFENNQSITSKKRIPAHIWVHIKNLYNVLVKELKDAKLNFHR